MNCKNYNDECGTEKMGCKGCYYYINTKKMIFAYTGKVKDLKLNKKEVQNG